jgi:hypothetical protein
MKEKKTGLKSTRMQRFFSRVGVTNKDQMKTYVHVVYIHVGATYT